MAEAVSPTDNAPYQSVEYQQANFLPTDEIESGGVVSQSGAVGKLIRSRASKPKVKTGCDSCRKRHVRCDETRPECKRCLKARLRCSGYFADNVARPRVGNLAIRPLLPREDAVSALTLARPSSLLLNESEIERRYFQHFQDQTMSGFSMNFDNSLWNKLVLQTSRQEPFVRHAVVAIGAISKSVQMDLLLDTAYQQPMSSIEHQNEMTMLHRKFALLEYSKSLKEIKDVISKGSFSPRQALLASLLSFCFENFLGNRPVAMYHAQTGHQILQTWISENPHSVSHSVGISSPAPHVIEDELVHAFSQLDLQILTIADARSQELHDSLRHLGDATIANMPVIFRDVKEARVYWDIVMARSYHFLLIAWEISRSEELARPFVTKSPSHTFITNGSKTLHGTPNILTHELLEQQRIYAEELSRWHSAFHPIWMVLPKTTQNKEMLMAAMVLINFRAVEIMVAAVIFPNQTSYDEYLPSFQQIIDLIETHVLSVFESNTRPLDGGFLLDLGITCPLGVVAMRCRDRMTRRKAITMLQSWFTEGPTDPIMVSKVGTFIMEIEEEGNESGIIPESSRAFPTLYCLDHVNNTILMQFCQKNGGSDGGPVWREKKFDW